MENDKHAKLVDGVISSAIAMDVHPYSVINRMASMIPLEERQKFTDDIQVELIKIGHTLPWSF